jgi:hypothetical protein
MKFNRYASAFFFIALCISSTAWACRVPKPGVNMEYDELIRKADTIALVRLQTSVSSKENEPHPSKFTLETVEVIKGTASPSYEFLSFGQKESDNDFTAHTDKKFWKKPVGRSEWPCCICGPDHVFLAGRIYLYFPDKLGAMKSAEVILKSNDRWLKYVRTKVKMDAIHRSQKTR